METIFCSTQHQYNPVPSMHSWSISTTSEPILQSRFNIAPVCLHTVLHLLSSAPEGSGRGKSQTQNPIHTGWTKKTQAQLSISFIDMLNLSHLPLVTWTEVGRVRSIVMACSCPWVQPLSHNTDTSPELCLRAEVRIILSIFPRASFTC